YRTGLEGSKGTVTVYDTRKGYDIELNSLIVSGCDARNNVTSYKIVMAVPCQPIKTKAADSTMFERTLMKTHLERKM
ncbi:hypothetical protein X777_08650, partial [Ooceraea biroi]